jgi:hypothetical protein
VAARSVHSIRPTASAGTGPSAAAHCRRVLRGSFAQLDDPLVHPLGDLSHRRRVRRVAQVSGRERRSSPPSRSAEPL